MHRIEGSMPLAWLRASRNMATDRSLPSSPSMDMSRVWHETQKQRNNPLNTHNTTNVDDHRTNPSQVGTRNYNHLQAHASEQVEGPFGD
jgi:hypothetical protein